MKSIQGRHLAFLQHVRPYTFSNTHTHIHTGTHTLVHHVFAEIDVKHDFP